MDSLDRFALDFAKFVDKNYYQDPHLNNRYAKSQEDFNGGKIFTLKQLLKIFKDGL